MLQTISAIQARQGFGEMLNAVRYRNETFLIKRLNQPMAAVIPASMFEDLDKYYTQTIKKAGKRNNMKLSEAYKLIEEAKKYARQSRH